MLKTPHYRIEDMQTGLAVQFHCEAASAAQAPKVLARLVAPEGATVFMNRDLAADCFARYLSGEALEIVRVDA